MHNKIFDAAVLVLALLALLYGYVAIVRGKDRVSPGTQF